MALRNPHPALSSLLPVVCALVLAAATPAQCEVFEVLHTFDNPPQRPTGGLSVGADGLYGAAASGGSYNYGAIFRFVPPTAGTAGSLSKIYSFPDTDYALNLGNPTFGLVSASDGNFYGIRQGGSWSGYTAIYRMTAGGEQTLFHQFSWPGEGGNPEGPLVELGAELYGTCRWGGLQVAYDYPGTVFRIGLDGQFEVLHQFLSGAEGRWPSGGLVVRPGDQKLFGVTRGGGTFNAGTLFSIDPVAKALTTHHSFDPSADGSGPTGELAVGPDGVVYGAAPYGDNALVSCGSIFRFGEATGFEVLKTFPCAAGGTKRPVGGMVLLGDWLYGITWGESISQRAGPGTVYRFNVVTREFQTLREYSPEKAYQGRLLLAPDGFIYGQSRGAGSSGADAGSIFRVDPTSGTVTTLHEFGPSEGPRQPFAMAEDAHGHIVGTSRDGGSTGKGMVFRLLADGTVETVHAFTDGGPYSWGTTTFLTRASDGVLYGTRSNGGENGAGSIFTLQPDDTYMQLVTFSSREPWPNDNFNPHGALIESTLNPGTFYGSLTAYGLYGRVFEMDRNGVMAPLVRTSSEVGPPKGRLAETANGDLYGVIPEYVRFEGGYGYGRVFRLAASGGFSIVYTFDWTNGYWPAAGLTEGPVTPDGSRMLYGTTEHCGSPSCTGTVYRVSPSGEFKPVHKFTGGDGDDPTAELTMAADGRLYGSTQRGGQFGYGTLFVVTPDDRVEPVYHFDHTTGATPEAALFAGSDGNLYGATTQGGPGGGGVVFRYNLAPTVSTAGPYDVLEGGTVTLTASGSDPQGGALQFAWDLDGDGAYDDGNGASVPYAATTPARDGDGTYAVAVRVTDDTGITAVADTAVTVHNVAPQVSVGGSATLEIGGTLQRSGSFTDPGPDTWTATVNYGDGSGTSPLVLAGKTFALTHTYSASGTFTVTVVVRDDDGGQGTGTFTVEVGTAEDSITDLIGDVEKLLEDGSLKNGQAKSLIGKLQRALDALASGDTKKAITMLESFIQEVEAYLRAGVLTHEEGDPLLAQARAALASIQ